jgi:hypothetical protein
MLTACQIVGYAHAHEPAYVHCDLKPGNIMIDARGATRVLDWGLARMVAEGFSEREGRSGTPGFVAPSLCAGGPMTLACDVYSLGATLAAVLFGLTPDRLPALYREDTSASPRPLRAIVRQAMADRPDGLYPSAAEMAADLQHYLDGEPVVADREPLGERVWRWVSRHKTASVAAILSTLVLIVAIAVVALGFRKAAHDATILAAREAAHQGDWTTALESYQRAIADRDKDATTLRAERLFGFFTVDDQASLEAELTALERRPDLGRLAARVALVRGATLLCNATTEREGRESVTRALEARADLGFSRADVPFAEALAETRPRKVVERLREAVRLDPLHLPANSSLLVALMATGDLDGACRQADQMQALLPDSILPACVRVMTAIIEGDRDGMSRKLDELEARLGTEKTADVAAFRTYCEHLDNALKRFDEFRTLDGGVGAVDGVKLLREFSHLRGETEAVLRRFSFPVPTLGLWFESVEALVDANRMWKDGSEPAFRHLIAMSEDSPEAFVLALATSNRLNAGLQMFLRSDFDGTRTTFAEVARLGHQAANAPTLAPRSPIRYQSRILCAIADVVLLKITRVPAPEHRERIRDELHRLIVDGRRWPGERQNGLNILLTLLTVSLTREQARDWVLDRPEGARAFMDRRGQLFRFGRTLVEDWLEDQPDNKLALGWIERLKKDAESDGLSP